MKYIRKMFKGRGYRFKCTECETVFISFDNFKKSIENIKNEGWLVYNYSLWKRILNLSVTICPECRRNGQF